MIVHCGGKVHEFLFDVIAIRELSEVVNAGECDVFC